MVFDPAFIWALSFLHVMIASGVIFEGADMTVQTEAELAVTTVRLTSTGAPVAEYRR